MAWNHLKLDRWLAGDDARAAGVTVAIGVLICGGALAGRAAAGRGGPDRPTADDDLGPAKLAVVVERTRPVGDAPAFQGKLAVLDPAAEAQVQSAALQYTDPELRRILVQERAEQLRAAAEQRAFEASLREPTLQAVDVRDPDPRYSNDPREPPARRGGFSTSNSEDDADDSEAPPPRPRWSDRD